MSITNSTNLIETITTLRKKQGLSQVELAEKAGLGVATIKRLETGKFFPDGNSLLKLAEALNCVLILKNENQDYEIS
jgi:transcriptional regulator with XRE-family HTH domain